MRLTSRFFLFASVMSLTTSSLAAGPYGRPDYPAAPRDGTVDTYFGTKVPAPYQWMENTNDPKLRGWVDAENRLAADYLEKIPERVAFERRLTELWNYAKEDTPIELRNGMLFFRRNSGLQNQSVLVVQMSATSQPHILLDPNSLSPDGSVALTDDKPSPGGKFLAYALSRGGSDWQTIHVLDVASGKPLADALEWVKFSGIAWTNDEKGFYYSRFQAQTGNEATRINAKIANQKLYYHRVGTPQFHDQMIYQIPDHPEWGMSGSVSEDGRYLIVTVYDGTSPKNRLYYADLGDALRPDVNARVRPLYTKGDARYSPIGVQDQVLYLSTTLGAPRGRIVAAALRTPDPRTWRVVVPQADGVLADAVLADGRILVNYQTVAKSQLLLFDTRGIALSSPALPTLGTVRDLSARNDSKTAYFAFTSYLYPTTIYQMAVQSGKISVRFKPDVRFDPASYATRQVFYTSKDGTQVPMFIVARRGLPLDGSHPAVLYGYGGFDISLTPSFNPVLPVWLEMGGVYAVANIRGGGEMGEDWHEAGMTSRKQNVFDDFAWAAKYLIRSGYTSPKHLGIQGFSNGGLLTGASITQHPDLFGAALVGHGVLDMLRYQKFSGGAYWVPEFGSSDNEQAFRWLIKYSPLQNVHIGTCYPPTLITTSWDDDRVVPSHAFKFAAMLQYAQGCDNPVLLQTSGSTSHTYMPTDKQIRQAADVWAFMAHALGAEQARGAHD